MGDGQSRGLSLHLGLSSVRPSTRSVVALLRSDVSEGGSRSGVVKLTPQSDQFSLGLVLRTVRRKRAFVRASAAETMTAIIREDAEPIPASAPAPLRWVIERLLAKEPAERYDTSRDLYRELRQIRERLSETTSASQTAVAQAPTKNRRILPMIGVAAVALAMGVALALWLMPPAQADLSCYKFTSIARDGGHRGLSGMVAERQEHRLREIRSRGQPALHPLGRSARSGATHPFSQGLLPTALVA